MRRRERQERLSGFRGRLTDRGTAHLDRLATDRVALVWRPARVALNDRHATEADVQLLGDDLRESRLDAGAQLHLAAVEGHATVLADRKPGVDLVGGQRLDRARWGHRLGRELGGKAERDDERAAALEERSP